METDHEFLIFSAGISRYTEGSRLWRRRRAISVPRTSRCQAGRDFQDRVIGKRLLHIRTPLQRRLDAAMRRSGLVSDHLRRGRRLAVRRDRLRP